MPLRQVRLGGGADALRAGFEAVRREVGVPGEHSEAALAEAAAAAPKTGTEERTDALAIPFLTIDPPGSRDLDQALHLERRDGGGFRVRYAIADVAAFVAPGGALDAEAWARGVTYYSPDSRAPLHPPVLAEGAASLLPGEERPALLWTLDLDAEGALQATDVGRARVRSREQLTYEEAQGRLDTDPVLRLLREVGELRAARERARGGVHLPLPEQEVVPDAQGGWTVEYRDPLPVEEHNAQISLLTGMAAADLMLGAGVGLLRTVPEADPKALARLRRAAAAMEVPWPDEMPYAEFIRSLDPSDTGHAALMHEATAVLRGAAYVAFDGASPEVARHAALAEEYAHVTAPLRRLADRYVGELCVAICAGEAVPAWIREALPRLPEAMAEAARRAAALERAIVDLVETAILAGRDGETFRAAVVDDELVQLCDLAVRARIPGAHLPVGEVIDVRLDGADLATRTVRFGVIRPA